MSEKLHNCRHCPKNGNCGLQDNPIELQVECSACHQQVAVKLPDEPPLILMFMLLERDSYICEVCDAKQQAN